MYPYSWEVDVNLSVGVNEDTSKLIQKGKKKFTWYFKDVKLISLFLTLLLQSYVDPQKISQATKLDFLKHLK